MQENAGKSNSGALPKTKWRIIIYWFSEISLLRFHNLRTKVTILRTSTTDIQSNLGKELICFCLPTCVALSSCTNKEKACHSSRRVDKPASCFQSGRRWREEQESDETSSTWWSRGLEVLETVKQHGQWKLEKQAWLELFQRKQLTKSIISSERQNHRTNERDIFRSGRISQLQVAPKSNGLLLEIPILNRSLFQIAI
jgi:hypothetical protein